MEDLAGYIVSMAQSLAVIAKVLTAVAVISGAYLLVAIVRK